MMMMMMMIIIIIVIIINRNIPTTWRWARRDSRLGVKCILQAITGCLQIIHLMTHCERYLES